MCSKVLLLEVSDTLHPLGPEDALPLKLLTPASLGAAYLIFLLHRNKNPLDIKSISYLDGKGGKKKQQLIIKIQ